MRYVFYGSVHKLCYIEWELYSCAQIQLQDNILNFCRRQIQGCYKGFEISWVRCATKPMFFITGIFKKPRYISLEVLLSLESSFLQKSRYSSLKVLQTLETSYLQKPRFSNLKVLQSLDCLVLGCYKSLGLSVWGCCIDLALQCSHWDATKAQVLRGQSALVYFVCSTSNTFNLLIFVKNQEFNIL